VPDAIIVCAIWFNITSLAVITHPSTLQAQMQTSRIQEAKSDSCAKPGDDVALELSPRQGELCWDYGTPYKDTSCVQPGPSNFRLSLEANCHDFGKIPLDRPPRYWTLGISNRGANAIKITELLVEGTITISDEIVSLEPCQKVDLKTCMYLTEPGRFKQTIIIKCEEPCEPVSFTLYATGVVPVLQADKSIIDFETVLTDSFVIKELIIRNVGEDILTIEKTYIRNTAPNCAFTIVERLPDKISPMEQDTISIRFSPRDTNACKDTLILESDSYVNKINHIELTGQGFLGPVLRPSFLAHSFGNICPGQSDSVRLGIRNGGNEPLVVDSLSSNNPKLFPVPPFADTLMKGESREVWLEYRPRKWLSSGSDSAQITIHAQADTADSVVALSGTTPQFPGILVPNDTLRFAATPIFCRVDSNFFTLINNGACSLFVDTISVVHQTNVFTPRLTQTSLAPNERKTIWLDFKPNQADTFNDTLKLTYRFGDADSVALFGIGLSGANAMFDQTSHDFGALCLQESASWSFTLKNTGYCALDITEIIQAWPEVFKIYPQQKTIHPQEEQTFVVKFDPPAHGDFEDTLRFETAAGILTPAITLRGQGLTFELEASPEVLAFGEVQLESVRILSFPLINRASHSVEIDTVEFNATKCGFSLLSPQTPFSLSSGEDTTVSIKFKPDTLGDCKDTLKIIHDATCARDRVILCGVGIAPKLCAPDSHDFGAVQISGTTMWPFQLEDCGNDTLKIAQIIPPTQSNIFKLELLGGDLLPGERRNGKVTFCPQDRETYSDSIVIFSSAWRNSRHVIRLSGEGKDFIGPSITHQSICIWTQGVDLPLTAAFTDNLGHVSNRKLCYRMGGASNFTCSDLSDNDTSSSTTISGALLGERGLEYYFEGTDADGHTTRAPSQTEVYAVSVRLPEGLCRPVPFHVGDTEQDYRMISIPLVLKYSSVDSLLQKGGFTEANHTAWRLFDYTNGNLVEFTTATKNSFRRFRPGRAFWFITNGFGDGFSSGNSFWQILKQQGKAFCSDSVRTVATSSIGCPQNQHNFIALEPSWNMIANPFTNPIPKKWLQQFDGADSTIHMRLLAYDGCWKLAPDSLQAWEGYAIKIGEPIQVIFAEQTQAAPTDPLPCSGNAPECWTLQIIARSGEHEDAVSYAGVRADANAEWDRYDLFDPPTIGACVNVAFPHFNWAQYPDRYAGDFRSPFANGEVWEFEVKSNLKESKITLITKNSVNFPSHLSVYIYDKNRQALQNLREKADYTFNNLGELLPGRFELLIGTLDFVQSRTTAIANNLPDEIQLYQNFPNPFNQETIFSFYLPQAAPVTLKVFDVLGREVRVLSDNETWEKGRNFLGWDSRNQTGSSIGSGVYFLSFTAGTFKQQLRVTLAK